MTYVLDASAVLRFIDHEAGAERVADILTQAKLGLVRTIISAVHYGEVVGVAYKRGGSHHVDQVASQLENLDMPVIPVDDARAARSAIFHVTLKIPYADSFALELANLPEHVLVTADYDFKLAPQNVAIEFLPTKRKS